jgi:hypothetical protein
MEVDRKTLNYAELIAAILNIEMPHSLDQNVVRRFIEQNEEDFLLAIRCEWE